MKVTIRNDVMKDKQIKKLSKKCTKIRDMLLDEKLKTDEDVKKKIKKLMSKEEIEQLAVQFLLKEALGYLLEEQQGDSQKENETTEMMFG